MPGYNLSRLSFLVVDDNKHMRALVKTLLHSLGVKNVIEAADGADGFKELCQSPADIIISNWSMSPMDGLDFVRMVRTSKDSPNPFCAIIMLTGHTEMHRVLTARDTGINEFMAKPISAKGLYARIRTIIENPRNFVRTDIYFGPDRRRRQVRFEGTDRRLNDAEVRPNHEPASEPAAVPAEAAPPQDTLVPVEPAAADQNSSVVEIDT